MKEKMGKVAAKPKRFFIHAQIDEELSEALRVEAEKDQRTVANFVRKVLYEYIERQREGRNDKPAG